MKTATILASLIALTSTAAFANPQIPAGKYNIDPSHSKIGFEIPHLVVSTVEGRFSKFEGQIHVDQKLEKSKVSADIDVASVSTENKDRDDHLRSADFFDVAKNPKMLFTTKKITVEGDKLKIVGDLTIKGTKRQVTLDAKYLGSVKDGYGNDKIALTATTKVNRKDFGLSWSSVVEAGPVVGDEVTITLKLQAAKVVEKAIEKKG